MGELPILEDLEQDVASVRMYERAKMVLRALDETDELNDSEVSKRLEWETKIRSLHTPYPPFPRRKGPRFVPLIELADAPPYPDVSRLMQDEEPITYYRNRVDEVKNPLDRSRYADFLWEALRKQRSDDAHRYARIAVQAYLNSVELYTAQEAYVQLVDALTRAIELSILLNDQTLAATVKDSVFSTLSALPPKPRGRWILELGRAVIVLRKSNVGNVVSNVDLEQVLDFAEEGADLFSKKHNYHLQRQCLLLAADVTEIIRGRSATLALQREVAESFDTEATIKAKIEGPAGGSLVAAHFYEQAIHQYLRLLAMGPEPKLRSQIRSQIATLKTKIRECLKEAEDEVTPIIQEGQLPIEEINGFIEPLLASESAQVLQSIAVAEWLMPDVEKMRLRAEKHAEENLFLRFGTSNTIRAGTKIRAYRPSEKELEVFNLEMKVFVQFQMYALDYVFRRLEEAEHWSRDALVTYLRAWELMDERDVELIDVGLERYFARDYVSTVHILAPRVENILKGMFEKTGEPLLADPGPRGELLQEGLGKFLHDHPGVVDTLGEQIWSYLEYVLVNAAGLNLRNDVAHGWISKERCNRFTANVLIYVLLVLTRFGVGSTVNNGEEEENDITNS